MNALRFPGTVITLEIPRGIWPSPPPRAGALPVPGPRADGRSVDLDGVESSTERASDLRECAFTAAAISALAFFRSPVLWNEYCPLSSSVRPSLPVGRRRWRAAAAEAAAASASGGEIIWSVMGSHYVRGRTEEGREGGREWTEREGIAPAPSRRRTAAQSRIAPSGTFIYEPFNCRQKGPL